MDYGTIRVKMRSVEIIIIIMITIGVRRLLFHSGGLLFYSGSTLHNYDLILESN